VATSKVLEPSVASVVIDALQVAGNFVINDAFVLMEKFDDAG
jgi:hypothetical protein